MGIKHGLISIIDDINFTLKETLFNAVNPRIELSIDKDGKISGKGQGLIASRTQNLIDYYCDRLNKQKVIARKNGSNVYSLYHPPFPSPGGDRAIIARIRDSVFKLRTPTTNTMALTYKCQCRCVHCSAEVKIDKRRTELKTDEWHSVIDDAVKLGIYNHVITGGEPCIRKDLPEIIAHVTPDKGTVLMFTNGTLLTERARELADAGLYAVNISIDDLNPETHNILRRTENCFEKAFEGASTVREHGILTGLSTYATKEKIHNGSLEELIELAGKEGFNEVTIFDPIPSGKWMRDTSFLLDEEERVYLRNISSRYNKMSEGPGVIAQSYVNSPHGSGCFGGYFQVYTTAYGDINPCDFNPVSFGNIRNGGLLKSWHRMIHHPEYRRRRKQCRMQDREYRSKFIDSVPDGLQWPIPIEFYETNGKFKPAESLSDSAGKHRQTT